MDNLDLESKKRAWTLQLYREFDSICFNHRIKLERPVVMVLDLNSRWGHWDAKTRTLALSTKLLTQHAWGSVLQVFKHELAHQYVDEILRRENGHGTDFKQACVLLGVEPWAQKAQIHDSALLEDLNPPQQTHEDNSILRRVERLLALTQSTNEHEALAAMKKVAELQEKYELDRLQSKRNDEFSSILIDHKLKRLPAFHVRLSSILLNYFSVKVVFTTQYDKDSLCEFKALEILGRSENTKIAEYVYWYLYNTLSILWSQYQDAHHAKGLTARHSYYLGVLKGFEDKLYLNKKERSEQKQEDNAKTGLIKWENKQLESYVEFKYPRLYYSKSSSRRQIHSKVYHDGIAKGKELEIREGLSHSKKGEKMKYLGPSIL